MQDQFGRHLSIDLPDFQTSACQHLTVCGEVVNPIEFQPSTLQEGISFTVSYVSPTNQEFYLSVLADPKKPAHLHIDVGPAEHFRRVKLDTNRTLQDLENIMRLVMGSTVEVEIIGAYKVGIDNLPPEGLIRTLLFQKKRGNVILKMTGGTLSFEGSPLSRMNWSIEEATKIARVHLHAEKAVSVGKDYLTSQLAWLGTHFETFVLGEEINAADT